VRLDEQRAIETLPALVGNDATGRKTTLDLLRRVLVSHGDLSGEAARRLAQVEAIFDAKAKKVLKGEPTDV
jgi:hypothetical protein